MTCCGLAAVSASELSRCRETITPSHTALTSAARTSASSAGIGRLIWAWRRAASALRIDDLDTVAVHHTDDPEVLIVELVARATVTTTGHAFTARSIQVFRIRDGKILLFRDYANPSALAEALGA